MSRRITHSKPTSLSTSPTTQPLSTCSKSLLQSRACEEAVRFRARNPLPYGCGSVSHNPSYTPAQRTLFVLDPSDGPEFTDDLIFLVRSITDFSDVLGVYDLSAFLTCQSASCDSIIRAPSSNAAGRPDHTVWLERRESFADTVRGGGIDIRFELTRQDRAGHPAGQSGESVFGIPFFDWI